MIPKDLGCAGEASWQILERHGIVNMSLLSSFKMALQLRAFKEVQSCFVDSLTNAKQTTYIFTNLLDLKAGANHSLAT